jgi:hypothetical protein
VHPQLHVGPRPGLKVAHPPRMCIGRYLWNPTPDLWPVPGAESLETGSKSLPGLPIRTRRCTHCAPRSLGATSLYR